MVIHSRTLARFLASSRTGVVCATRNGTSWVTPWTLADNHSPAWRLAAVFGALISWAGWSPIQSVWKIPGLSMRS